jgi:DNA gyrase subunit B
MARDYGAEIDSLREELAEIRELLQSSTATGARTPAGEKPERAGHIYKVRTVDADDDLIRVLDRLEDSCGESGGSGRVAYAGVFSSGGRQSTWVRDDVDADKLLSLIEHGEADKVLRCIGSNDRLRVLLGLLRKPMTVTQLVDECGYNSTGQVYHHLKPLIAADLVVEDTRGEGRGVYAVQPHRVQGIIMLLAGISDMLDPKYTKGSWEAAE